MKTKIYTKLLEYLNSNYNFKSLSSSDLYNIAKYGLENDYYFSGCFDDTENIEEAIELALDDFNTFLNQPYPIGLGNIPNKPIIYRLIKLKNIEELNKNRLGNSWYSNIEQTDKSEFFDMLDYLKKSKDYTIFRLKGQTNIENIDVYNTLWQRSTQYHENEIVILDESKIKLLEIVDFYK